VLWVWGLWAYAGGVVSSVDILAGRVPLLFFFHSYSFLDFGFDCSNLSSSYLDLTRYRQVDKNE